jgi:RHS repeat-associated protein
VKPNNTINIANTHKVTYYSYDANGQVMAVYDVTLGTVQGATLAEQHIYGASRLGLIAADKEIVNSGSAQPEVYDRPTQILGLGRYELTNHLGNVNAVINDRKLWSATSSSYEAVVWQKADYYPFGMPMKDRSSYHLGESYRYGYNGMELDNEPKGNGNSYTTEFRQYDPRLGRWLSLDPLMAQFPWMSPYVAFDDNPVLFTDPFGLEAEGWGGRKNESGGYTWEYSDGITASNYGEKGFEVYMDEGVRENFNAGDGYTGSVYLTLDGNIEKLDGGLEGSVTANAPAPFIQSDDQTGETPTYDMNSLNFNTSGNGLSAFYDPINEQGFGFKDQWTKQRARMATTERALMISGAIIVGGPLAAAGVTVAAPTIGAGWSMFGGSVLGTGKLIWSGFKYYHRTFGVNGGYQSMADNAINQSSTQVAEKGSISVGNYDLLSFGTSAFVTKRTGLAGQFLQGASGTYLSYSISGGWDGALIKNKSSNYIFLSTMNEGLGTLMNRAPILPGLSNDIFGGAVQGVFNRIEDEKK